MRSVAFAVATLAIAAAIAIGVWGHRTGLSTEQLEARCKGEKAGVSAIGRMRACRSLAARQRAKPSDTNAGTNPK